MNRKGEERRRGWWSYKIRAQRIAMIFRRVGWENRRQTWEWRAKGRGAACRVERRNKAVHWEKSTACRKVNPSFCGFAPPKTPSLSRPPPNVHTNMHVCTVQVHIGLVWSREHADHLKPDKEADYWWTAWATGFGPSSHEEGVRFRLSFNENVKIITVILHPNVGTQTWCSCPHGDGEKTTTLNVQEPFWRLRAKQLAVFCKTSECRICFRWSDEKNKTQNVCCSQHTLQRAIQWKPLFGAVLCNQMKIKPKKKNKKESRITKVNFMLSK